MSVITENGGSVGRLFRDTAKRVWAPVADPFASIVPPCPRAGGLRARNRLRLPAPTRPEPVARTIEA